MYSNNVINNVPTSTFSRPVDSVDESSPASEHAYVQLQPLFVENVIDQSAMSKKTADIEINSHAIITDMSNNLTFMIPSVVSYFNIASKEDKACSSISDFETIGQKQAKNNLKVHGDS